MSADTIAPGKENPQNRNRYSYALNNPLRWVDPSGHCVEDGFDQTLEGCISYLTIHEWELVAEEWTYDTLRVMAESVRDLKAAAGWDRDAYVNTMTANGKYHLRLDRAESYAWDWGRPADVRMRGDTILMTVYDALFKGDIDMQRFNLVHEQAHVWDFASGGAMSQGLMDATGSSYWLWFYNPKGATSTAYRPNHLEDWAETVAAAVYPDAERSIDGRTNKPRMGDTRQNHIRAFLPNAKLFQQPCCPDRS